MDGIVKHETGLTAHPGRGINSLIESFLKAHRVKEQSRGTYRRYMRMFSGWIKKQPKPAGGYYTRENIEDYVDHLTARGLKTTTISNALGAVRCFFTWAESMAYYPNIAKGVKGPKRSRNHKKDALTPDQIRAILAAINRETLEGARDFAVINLMIRAGLRTVEIIRANIGDMGTLDGEEVLRIQGKGRDDKEDLAVLTPAILAPVRAYLARRGPVRDEAPLFAAHGPNNDGGRITTKTIRRNFKAYAALAGIVSSRITAHSCRHTAVTLLLKSGGTIQAAQVLARHADINTTLIYAHNLDRIKTAPEYQIDAYLDGAQGGGL